MAYERKTKDVIVLQRFSQEWGWEDLSTYSKPDYERPYRSAQADLKEYRMSGDHAPYRMLARRERLQVTA